MKKRQIRLRHISTQEYLFEGATFKSMEEASDIVNSALMLDPFTVSFVGFLAGVGVELIEKKEDGYEVITFGNKGV